MPACIYFRSFFALCICTALFACSDDDAAPTHAELCKNGPSVECLLGSWKLDAIDNKTGNSFITVDREVGGRLTLSDDMWYVFESAQISHEGTWAINEDKTIAFDCLTEREPTYKCPANNLEDYQIELESGGDILRIHGSPFFNYRSSKPVEKFLFLP